MVRGTGGLQSFHYATGSSFPSFFDDHRGGRRGTLGSFETPSPPTTLLLLSLFPPLYSRLTPKSALKLGPPQKSKEAGSPSLPPPKWLVFDFLFSRFYVCFPTAKSSITPLPKPLSPFRCFLQKFIRPPPTSTPDLRGSSFVTLPFLIQPVAGSYGFSSDPKPTEHPFFKPRESTLDTFPHRLFRCYDHTRGQLSMLPFFQLNIGHRDLIDLVRLNALALPPIPTPLQTGICATSSTWRYDSCRPPSVWRPSPLTFSPPRQEVLGSLTTTLY